MEVTGGAGDLAVTADLDIPEERLAETDGGCIVDDGATRPRRNTNGRQRGEVTIGPRDAGIRERQPERQRCKEQSAACEGMRSRSTPGSGCQFPWKSLRALRVGCSPQTGARLKNWQRERGPRHARNLRHDHSAPAFLVPPL